MKRLASRYRNSHFHPGIVLILAGLLFLAACSGDMADQPKYEPLEASAFFPDDSSARPLVDGTVHWETPVEQVFFMTGRSEDGEYVDALPFQVSFEVLEQGREQYDIYCSPCHGLSGYGEGMIVQRGLGAPPSLHIDRLREAPAGYIYDVITNGIGRMFSYAYRVEPVDRWAIVAYVRALQLSQNARLEDVPPEAMQTLQEAEP